MTTKDKVEIRIRELVPELKECACCGGDGCDCCGGIKHFGQEPRLEHILMAIEKVKKWYLISSDGGFADVDKFSTNGFEKYYDLSKSFSDQSEELYLFLLDILK